MLIDMSMALYFWCDNFENLFIVEVYSTFSSVTLVDKYIDYHALLPYYWFKLAYMLSIFHAFFYL